MSRGPRRPRPVDGRAQSQASGLAAESLEPAVPAPRDGPAWHAEALDALRRLDVLGLNRGSTGNLSWRAHRAGEAGLWITPTGLGAGIGEDDWVWMPLGAAQGNDGAPSVRTGAAPEAPPSGGAAATPAPARWRPSSEWPMHHAIYAARPDLHAVVHVHAPNATALACLRRPLPAFHYMVAVAGGSDVPLVPYHRFGSEALSRAVAQAMAERQACLLANHGLVSAGATPAKALAVAVEIESLCGSYLQALAVGEPVLLSDDEMAEVLVAFAGYGQARAAPG